MAKTIEEVRRFLDSQVGRITPDKSDPNLNGQCVSLIKNLLEFVGAPNPYGARGNAKDLPNTYVPQGIARVGKGTLNVAVNRYGGGGYGHVWVKIGSDSWQANWAGFHVKKNVGEDPITDILNLDQWLTKNTGGGTTASGGKVTNLGVKGEALIKKFEGCKLTAYDIGDGMITIGWGHAERKGQTSLVTGVTKWTQAQADSQFRKDIVAYANAVNNYFTRSFNQNQFDAMVSFSYNNGTNVFGKDKWDRNAFNSYVTESFANYINKGTIYEAGLKRRRQEEINLFNTPVSGGVATIKKGGVTMQCLYERPINPKTGVLDQKGTAWTIMFCNGVNTRRVYHPDEVHIIKEVYRKNNGKEIPVYNKNQWSKNAPWYIRLESMFPVVK